MLCCRNVGVSFGDSEVLRDIDLTFTPQRRVAIVGQSGCGKTTLLRVLAGLIPPTSGQCTFAAPDRSGDTPRVGFVFQKPTLLPWSTVWQNVTLPMRLGRQPAKLNAALRLRAIEWLNPVQLADVADRYPGELSGGMQMRVSLARALAADPEVLLLDEPFAALDDLLREQLGVWITQAWTSRPCVVVLVTHHLRDAVLLTDEVVLMHRGGILDQLDNPLSAVDPVARRADPKGLAFENELHRRLREAAT